MTAHTLIIVVQRQRWTVVIWLSRHGRKGLSRNTVTWQPVTGGRQHRTHARLPKAFQKEPKACEDVFNILPRFFKIFLESKCDLYFYGQTKSALSIIQVWFNYLMALFSRHLATLLLIIWKFPKSIAGRTKRPRGPRVETPDLKYYIAANRSSLK